MQSVNILIFNTRTNSTADTQFLLSKNTEKRLNLFEVNEQLRVAGSKKRARQTQASASNPSFLKKAKSYLLNLGKKSEIIHALYIVWGIYQDIARVRALFDSYEPELLILYDDRFIRPNLVVLREAKRQNIPALIISTAQTSIKSTYILRRDQALYHLDQYPWHQLKAYLHRRYPNQFHPLSKDQTICFFSPPETLILALFKMLPKQPWIWGGSGMAEHFCIPGTKQFEEMSAYGVDKNRITLTGHALVDAVFKTTKGKSSSRRDLDISYELDGKKRLIVCAVPQYGEHGYTDWPNHWRLTEELFLVLAQSGHEVLLSLHPKSELANYQPIAEKYNLHILHRPISEVLMAADLLIGTNSSVLAWGLGAGVPAIMIDLFELDDLYDGLSSIKKIDNHAELGNTIDHIFDVRNYPELHRLAKIEASRFGCFDGQNTDRIFEQIHRMVRGARNNRDERQESVS